MGLRRPLIIIPGLGDSIYAYSLVAVFWRLLGYEVHIFSFGWESHTEDFDTALDRLLLFIDKADASTVNMIGVSAGGTAAINALAHHRQIIHKVVTIATPYVHPPPIKNAKLKTSLDRLRSMKLASFGTSILSIHGVYDQTVPISESQPKGIKTQKVLALRHSIIITLTLTIYSTYIRRFLDK